MKNNQALRIIPLGGLGEFGMNIMALRWEDDILIIDCGKMFPPDDTFGIDSIVPDFSFLIENAAGIRGLVLTHGHEDHIGAVPLLRRVLDVPIYGTPLTLGLTRLRLKEHNLLSGTDLREVKRGETASIGPFEVHFIGVTHGIPDACALAVSTPAGVIIHTGDFKLDQTPRDGQTTDYHALAAYGQKGVLLLLGDSTNVERPGSTISEREVYDGFERIFSSARGKILVAAFASHFHRMQQVIELADEFGRSVAFCGRSMEQNSQLAQELGHLSLPTGMEISTRQVSRTPADKVVVIASGSQAERNSALSKIALDSHPDIRLRGGDIVALSARKIPGNEKSISALINNLYRRGAEVYHDGILDIHASGHACREELKLMLNLVKPRYFIPIHGDYGMLHLHSRLAAETCIAEGNVLLAESGDVVTVSERRIAKTDKVGVGRVLVATGGYDYICDSAIDERRHMAGGGLIVPVVAVRFVSPPVVEKVRFVTKGLGEGEELRRELASTESRIRELVQESSPEELRDEDLMQARIGKFLRRHLRSRIPGRPMILPTILET